MISLELEFRSDCVSSIMFGIQSLPESLRPTHFGDDEADLRRRKSMDDTKWQNLKPAVVLALVTGLYIWGKGNGRHMAVQAPPGVCQRSNVMSWHAVSFSDLMVWANAIAEALGVAKAAFG